MDRPCKPEFRSQIFLTQPGSSTPNCHANDHIYLCLFSTGFMNKSQVWKHLEFFEMTWQIQINYLLVVVK